MSQDLAKMMIANTDLRTEAIFRRSIAPATSTAGAMLLAFRDQMLYPFLQGFAWAVCKDWFVVVRVAATVKGHIVGRELNRVFANVYTGMTGAPAPAFLKEKQA